MNGGGLGIQTGRACTTISEGKHVSCMYGGVLGIYYLGVWVLIESEREREKSEMCRVGSDSWLWMLMRESKRKEKREKGDRGVNDVQLGFSF